MNNMKPVCLALVSVVMILSDLHAPARAAAPGSIEVTCDVDRPQFRSLARTQTQVTFRLWDSETGGAQCGPDYIVPVEDLVVFKRYTDRVRTADPVALRRRKALRVTAVLGDDGSPAELCTGEESWLEMAVGSQTLGCDFGRQSATPQLRRRLQSVPFARLGKPVDASASVFNNEETPILSDSYVPMPFGSERFDTASLHDQLNPTRMTVPSAGKYLVTGTLCYRPLNPSPPNPGSRWVSVRINGGPTNFAASSAPATANIATAVSISTILQLNAGDYVELFAYQDSGTTVDFCTGEMPNFTVYMLQ